MLRRITTISRITFHEAARSRLFYLTLGFLALLILIATPYAYATLGEPLDVIKNSGLAGASLGSISAIIIIGSTFLQKELSRRTIHLLLSRPLQRWELLVGKFIGLSLVGTALFIVMVSGVVGYTAALGDSIDWRLLWAIPYGIYEVIILSAVVIFFSTLVVTPVLNGMGALSIFIAGRSQEWMAINANSSQGVIASLPRQIIPDLASLQVLDGLIYNELPSIAHASFSAAYSVLYCLSLLILSAAIFKRRDIS